ncbi:hypothetical protein L2E82_20296 [Cichorium intybus]|uniref:Uncharacterized protein n=1 Tax=Cichorium intybus TaxID=13427 RepID=A0ACB9DTD4_CICIN|nr:hypothetical protein L2E82_20296 [Cichorium intybus]
MTLRVRPSSTQTSYLQPPSVCQSCLFSRSKAASGSNSELFLLERLKRHFRFNLRLGKSGVGSSSSTSDFSSSTSDCVFKTGPHTAMMIHLCLCFSQA